VAILKKGSLIGPDQFDLTDFLSYTPILTALGHLENELRKFCVFAPLRAKLLCFNSTGIT